MVRSLADRTFQLRQEAPGGGDRGPEGGPDDPRGGGRQPLGVPADAQSAPRVKRERSSCGCIFRKVSLTFTHRPFVQTEARIGSGQHSM